MAVDVMKLRRELGVRKAADIDTTVDFKMYFSPPHWVQASVHPAVVLTDTLEHAKRTTEYLAWDGHPVLAAEIRTPDDLALSIEGVIVAARELCHYTGGRTMDMHAVGSAVPIAAAAFAFERGYFDGFYAVEPVDAKIGGYDWKELKGV